MFQEFGILCLFYLSYDFCFFHICYCYVASFCLQNLVGLGAPNLRCRVPVEELKPCQAFLIKMFEAPISKSIVYAKKMWKVKERTTLISYRPLFLTVGHRDAHILSASNPSRWRIKPKPSCLVIGGPVDHPSQNCQNSILQPNTKPFWIPYWLPVSA